MRAKMPTNHALRKNGLGAPDTHVFIVLVVRGELEVSLRQTTLHLRPLSQLVILPGVACTLNARSAVAIQVISFLSAPPNYEP